MIMGALSRLAKRRPVRGYQEGGEVDDEDDYNAPSDDGDSQPQPQFGGGYTEALDDPEVAQGALSAVAQMPRENPYIKQLGDTAAAFPHGAEISGALNTKNAARDQSLAAQKQAIVTAMHNIATSGQGSTNLPLLMASAGLLRPTRTGSFGESIGNAADAAAPEILRERELARQNAIETGNLGIRAAGVDTQIAQSDLSDFYKQIGLGEAADTKAATATYQENTLRARAAAQAEALKAGAAKAAAANKARLDAAQIAADSRKAVAESYRSGRVDAATISASKGQYLGPSTKDPNVGLYLNPHTNQVAEGPASTGKGAANSANSKLVSDLQFMVNNGIAPDLSTAFAMRRSGVNDGATFQRLIQNEKKMLLGTPAGIDMSPAELENQAREMVVNRQPTAMAAGHPGGAAPAPAPPATATPPATVTPPPRPQNLPHGSAYSAKRKMWRDPAGRLYDESGKPVAAAAPIAPQVPNG